MTVSVGSTVGVGCQEQPKMSTFSRVKMSLESREKVRQVRLRSTPPSPVSDQFSMAVIAADSDICFSHDQCGYGTRLTVGIAILERSTGCYIIYLMTLVHFSFRVSPPDDITILIICSDHNGLGMVGNHLYCCGRQVRSWLDDRSLFWKIGESEDRRICSGGA
jgi:hypothetical protein